MEKTAIRNNLSAEKEQVVVGKIIETLGTSINFNEDMEKIKEIRAPIDAEYRQKFQEEVNKVEREYQREKKRQESVGETLSPNHTDIFAHLSRHEFSRNRKNQKKYLFSNGHSLLYLT